MPIGISLLPIFLNACANVTFHSDPELKTRTGLQYYISKPYLLVSRTGNKDSPIKVDVIQLPDLEHPVYAVYHPGWGSHQFTLSLNNGILSSYGQTADSKGPETIKAVADLASEAAAGFGSVANGVKALRTEAASLDPAIAAVQRAIGSLNAVAAMTDDLIGPFKAKREVAADLSRRLGNVLKSLKDGSVPKVETLTGIKSDIGKAMIPKSDQVPAAVAVNANFTDAQNSIDEAVTALRKAGAATTPEEKPDFDLYEIHMEGDRTQLIRVSRSDAITIIQRNAKSYGR
jgi:hypothetical protein